MTGVEVHPEVQRAMEAVSRPEVRELAKRLAEHGLAIAVPHKHGERGEFLPLPKDEISFEAGLKTSFRPKDDPEVVAGIPVAWKWDEELQAVAKCRVCSLVCHV